MYNNNILPHYIITFHIARSVQTEVPDFAGSWKIIISCFTQNTSYTQERKALNYEDLSQGILNEAVQQ